ncbi:hypothetical protein HID58_059150 [Brassica napus]|uniref:pyruvate dehydrogenase (acetyl-transferring) n=1 Tax=Brassica napus TaxID=3708 RepID=A0ABQ7ZS32_BRANA|nr:hypothetical protein HID58_059150 [Brassica napus]
MLPATSSTSSNSTYHLHPNALEHELLLFEALQEVLEEEIDRDPHVCLMGKDVGHYGGSYKVTKGLAEKFGDLRVLDTPICEKAFTAFNQISNNCGMLHYTSGGPVHHPVDPVILFEHVLLYNLKENIPDEENICNLEEPKMVIDIRSLKPFDLYTIGNSVNEVPTPYAGTLEEWTVVQPAQIATAVEQLC